MTNEEVFEIMKLMFNSNNHNLMMKYGKKLKNNNIVIKDLNTKLVIYNNNDRIILPTIGKGLERKYLWSKYKIENI